MPNLLTHALVAYKIARILSWHYTGLSPAYVTVVLAGAFIPHLTEIRFVVSSGMVEQVLGVPFDWGVLRIAGGALFAILIGGVIITSRELRRTFVLLNVGAASHLLADTLLLTPSGRLYALLWPLTRWHPPTPGLYLSTQPVPTVFAAVVAGLA